MSEINFAIDEARDEAIDDILNHSESDSDEVSNYLTVQDYFLKDSIYPTSSIDYVEEAKAIIKASNITSQNDVAIQRNALAINQHLQEYLRELKYKLEALLQTCRDKYTSNEMLYVSNVKESKASKKYGKSTEFLFCGKPYFKQKDIFSTAPPNSDYVYRKKAKHEYFPIDHIDMFRMWSSNDKLLLQNGVKEQLKKFITSNRRDAARKVTVTREYKSILEDPSLDRKELNEMFDMIKDRNFQIDWFTISNKDLYARHTENECIAIWINHLMPSLKRLPWNAEDDEKLLRIADEFNCQNWNTIGKEMGGRSGYHCIIRYQGLINDQNMLKNCRWTKAEDRFLIKAVETCRIGSFIPWTKVAVKFPLRAKHQVYNRYMLTLKPGIKKEKFTVEENCILTAAVKQYGTNFNRFSTNLLPGRTVVQIRNHYNNVLKHVSDFKEWTIQDDTKLMELTKEFGTANWVDVSKHLIHHTRTSCRSRYVTISTFLKKNPNCEVKDVPRRARKQSTNVKEDNWEEEIDNYKKKLLEAQIQRRQPKPIHDFFKLSYNFELKQLCDADYPASNKSEAISYMLQNTLYPKDHKLFYGPPDCRIDVTLVTKCEDSKEYTLPPNWSTALMLRGLSAMYPDTERKSDRVFATTPELQLFKKRFFLLLYSSAVASHTMLPDRQSTNSYAITNKILSTDADAPQSKRKKI